MCEKRFLNNTTQVDAVAAEVLKQQAVMQRGSGTDMFWGEMGNPAVYIDHQTGAHV